MTAAPVFEGAREVAEDETEAVVGEKKIRGKLWAAPWQLLRFFFDSTDCTFRNTNAAIAYATAAAAGGIVGREIRI